MGIYTSKIFANHGETDSKLKVQSHNNVSGNIDKHQCTPIMTRRSLSNDPRSVTIGIVRTPIEVDSTPTGITRRTASAIPKYLQIKPYLETDIDSVMDKLTLECQIPDPRSPNITCQRTPIVVKSVPAHKCPQDNSNIEASEHPINDLDPRSPAINFDRTPIMKPKSPQNIDKMSHDYIGKCNTELSNLPISYCETTIDYMIPELQVLPEIVSYKPLKLEKRLDSCDDIANEINLNFEANTDVTLEDSDSEGQITVIPNVNALINNSQSENIHDIIDGKINNEFIDINNCNVMNIPSKLLTNIDENELANGKIRVWRDSISPTAHLTDPKVEIFKTPEEIIIEFDDEQSIVKSHNKLDNATVKMEENKMINGMYAEKKKMQQLNRDIKLIYDDTKEYNVNGTIIIDTQMNRTPLGNRSNNHKSGMLIKSPQQLLKNKGHSGKLHQENTPPRIKRGKSKNISNATQWDLDRTVVI